MKTLLKSLALVLAANLMGSGCSIMPKGVRKPADYDYHHFDEKRAPEKSFTVKDETVFSIREKGHKIVESAARVFDSKAHRKIEMVVDDVSAGNVLRIEGDTYVAHRHGYDAAILYRKDRELPGRLRVTRVIKAQNTFFTDWLNMSEGEESWKKTIKIISVDETGETIQLTFIGCRPVQYIPPDKNSLGEEHFNEALELVFDKMIRK